MPDMPAPEAYATVQGLREQIEKKGKCNSPSPSFIKDKYREGATLWIHCLFLNVQQFCRRCFKEQFLKYELYIHQAKLIIKLCMAGVM